MVSVTLGQPVPAALRLTPGKGSVVTDQYAMTLKQAPAEIEATGADDAAKLIRDHAAAGLIRSYAQLQVTIAVAAGYLPLCRSYFRPSSSA